MDVVSPLAPPLDLVLALTSTLTGFSPDSKLVYFETGFFFLIMPQTAVLLYV